MDLNGEHTFLCGYQRIRRYGSTQDLNSPSTSSSGYRKPIQIIPHRVDPSDTLQSLELKYNSNMYEIKRLNRLWSNDSLHCKTIINIPIYDSSNVGTPINSAAQTPTAENSNKKFNPKKKPIAAAANIGNRAANLEVVNETESLEDFFKRIDSSVKQTQKSVKKLIKKAG
uniref:LysM domain-containing protein n=1 Tax=Panagrolaimus davidi TaxID=227884 RepID=A0A914PSM4_9BILA